MKTCKQCKLCKFRVLTDAATFGLLLLLMSLLVSQLTRRSGTVDISTLIANRANSTWTDPDARPSVWVKMHGDVQSSTFFEREIKQVHT